MRFNKGVKPMRKKLLSSVLSLALLLALMPTVTYAASDEATSCANALYQLGLFNGTGKDAQGNPNFDLDRTPTRFESVTMLVRLLGRASEAEKNSNTYNTPFVDVVEWAKPYVGYAYTNKLTSGTSGTTFGGAGNATVSQYITFVLRALGYESGVDFQWDKAWELSDKLGITNGQYNASTTNFTRGDVVIISYNALSINLKGKNTTLLDDLKARGVIKENTTPTTPNNPDIAEDGHIHNWQTVHFDAVGYYKSGGTHRVQVFKCDCGFKVRSDEPNAKEVWDSHHMNCPNNCIYWWEDVPNGDREWVEIVPAYDETSCTICGATK